MANPTKNETGNATLRAAWRACSGYFVAALLFSLAINTLYLTSPIYMMQIYDRVLASRSEATLLMLTVAMLAALLTLAVLDGVRAQVLIRAGLRLDSRLSTKIFSRQVERSISPATGPRNQLMSDLDTFRQFITGSGIHAMFDAPWMPIYVTIIFLFDPLLGTIALIAALLLLVLAVANEYATTAPLRRANELAFRNYGFTDSTLRNAEAIQAMGMLDNLLVRWRRDRLSMLGEQARASDRGAGFTSAIKFFRLFLQSGILGAGAWLVIEGRITPGAMYAASLLMGRALAPVEQIVGVWRPFSSARASFGRISRLLEETPERESAMALPRPQGRLAVEGVSYVPPGSERMTLRNLKFALEPGEALGIVGPSAAGKSTLARLLVGVWKPYAGAVRLDGANVYTWDRQDFGRHVGYLPQDIELFGGSIRDNIARFGDSDPEAVVAAAQAAGVHEMILRLPRGYETEIGEAGGVLSGGQRQRVGLARALYGNPQLLVLDEPNSNLDTEGEEALRRLLADLKQRGTTVVVVAHRPSVLSSVDKIMVMRDGAIEFLAPRNEAMARLVPGAVATHPAAPAAVAPTQR